MTNEKKTAKPADAAPETPAVPKTASEQIWEEIKGLPIEMFALPDQTVEQYCSPQPLIDPSRLYVLLRTSSVLPSLEESVKKGFTVEMADKWAIVTRRPPVPAHLAQKKKK